MKHRFIHRMVFLVLTPIFRMFFRWRYRFKPDRFSYKNRKKGPYLILSNHALSIDPLLVATSFKGPIYYVASDIIFTMGLLSKLIRFLVSPIPKTKSRSDMETIRDIMRRVKKGYNIGIFPEGNSTFTGETMTITKATPKLVKLLKVPVIFYHIEGGYFTKPRWGRHLRKGRTRGVIHSIWEPEDYKDLTIEQIAAHIEKELYVNDHELQKHCKIPYKGKNLAEDFESSFYVCPSCNSFHSLYSLKNKIHCQQCDLSVLYTKTGELIDTPQQIENTIDWYDFQVNASKRYLDTTRDAIFFEEHFPKTFKIEKSQKKRPIGPSKVVLRRETLKIENSHETLTIDIKDVTCAVQQKNKLIIYQSGTPTIYYLVGKKKTNALKYVTFTDILNKREVY